MAIETLLLPSFTSHSSSVSPLDTTSSALSFYADYLRAVYSTYPLAKSDKFPPTPSKVFIKLALVKKEEVSREMADEFTRLTLHGDIDQILRLKEPIEMDDILKDDKTHLVVVEGAPGIGKTTLAWELCRQWPTLQSLKRFSLVVLLRLREEGVQSATDISDLFPCGDDPGLSRPVAQEIRRVNGKGVLFVFDGFDEFPSKLRKKSLVLDIIDGSTFPKATVLVTSRPSASAQLQSLLQSGIGKHIEVVGFSEKEIFEYAESIFTKSSDMFIAFSQYLSANPVIKGMMYNPLNSAIVVGVYQDTYKSGKPVPHTQTQLYTELTLSLLSRYLSGRGDPLAKKLPDKLEDLHHHESYFHLFWGGVQRLLHMLSPYVWREPTWEEGTLYQQLMKVGRLAFEEIVKEKVIFKQLPEGCSDLGLLVEHTALYIRKERTTFNFFHLTLQEYMSAFYISQLSADEQRILFIEHSNLESMNVVWRFVAGLTKLKNIGWEEVKCKLEGKDNIEVVEYKVENDMMYVGPFLLQCVYEAQDVQSCESVFGNFKVNFLSLSSILSNYDSYALGYSISLCSNIWNVKMYNTTKESIELLGHGMKFVDYGGGTIDMLILFNSGGIMNEGKLLLNVPQQILQHIKILGLRSCDIDKRGFENLAECIPHLHSLTSLHISANPGSDGSLVKLFQELSKCGKLQTLNMWQVAIGMDDVVALAHLVQPQSSLRELEVGHSSYASSDVELLLIRTVFSPSSLKVLTAHVNSINVLNYIETISDSITNLTLMYHSPSESISNSSTVKGGTKLRHILRENTSLKKFTLFLPLDRDEVRDIVYALENNYSLEELVLSETYHSQHFSESERLALDPRIKFLFFL